MKPRMALSITLVTLVFIPSKRLGEELADLAGATDRDLVEQGIAWYNGTRLHRSLAHATPVPSERAEVRSASNFGRLRRCDILGGLIHEYEHAA
jgi:hypothetical protein